jgi:fructokinase
MSSGPPPLYGGVETGGTWIVCLIASAPDHIVAQMRFATTTPEAAIAQVGAFFAAQERVEAIGLGAFGPIGLDVDSPDWGVLGNTPKPGWSGAAIGTGLARLTGRPVVLDSDVNAAALGELRWGAGVGVDSLAYLTVGTGIGVGLIAEGRPLHGLLHPEAGHMRIPHDLTHDPFAGSCPFHRDCWEGLASGSAMASRWDRPAGELGDAHAGWDLEATYLAAGIANIILTVSPQRFIVGGGVFRHPGLLQRVRTQVTAVLAGYLDVPALSTGFDHYLVPAKLGEHAGALGAVALAAERRA